MTAVLVFILCTALLLSAVIRFYLPAPIHLAHLVYTPFAVRYYSTDLAPDMAEEEDGDGGAVTQYHRYGIEH